MASKTVLGLSTISKSKNKDMHAKVTVFDITFQEAVKAGFH